MVRLRKWLCVSLLLFFCGALAGCNGARETDELAYILAIGIDATEENHYEVTYQIAMPRSTNGGGSDNKKTANNISIKAASLAEARNLLNSITALNTVLYHAKVIVIGEALAKRGLEDVVGPLKRYREYRGSMYIAVTKGTAKDFLNESESILGLSPAKFFEESFDRYSETNYVVQTTLHQFYGRMKDRATDPYTAVIGVSPENTQIDINKEGNPKDSKGETFIAGQIPRKGGTKVGFVGTALFKAGKMVGLLNDKQTRCLNMLLGNFTYSFLSIQDPLVEKKNVNIYLHQEKRPSVHVALVDGKPHYDVDVSLEGDISSIASGTNYEKEQYQKILEEQVSQVIEDEMKNVIQVTQSVDCDAAGFGYYLRPLFSKQKELEEFMDQHQYQDSEVAVHVVFKVRRTGLMWQTKPIY